MYAVKLASGEFQSMQVHQFAFLRATFLCMHPVALKPTVLNFAAREFREVLHDGTVGWVFEYESQEGPELDLETVDWIKLHFIPTQMALEHGRLQEYSDVTYFKELRDGFFKKWAQWIPPLTPIRVVHE